MGELQFGLNLGKRFEQGGRATPRIGNPKVIEPRRHKGCESTLEINRIDKIEDKQGLA